MIMRKQTAVNFEIPAAGGRIGYDKKGEENVIVIEDIFNLLKSGTITSKGLKEGLKKQIIEFMFGQGYSNKEIAGLMSLSEQSLRNLRSKLKV